MVRGKRQKSHGSRGLNGPSHPPLVAGAVAGNASWDYLPSFSDEMLEEVDFLVADR